MYYYYSFHERVTRAAASGTMRWYRSIAIEISHGVYTHAVRRTRVFRHRARVERRRNVTYRGNQGERVSGL